MRLKPCCGTMSLVPIPAGIRFELGRRLWSAPCCPLAGQATSSLIPAPGSVQILQHSALTTPVPLNASLTGAHVPDGPARPRPAGCPSALTNPLLPSVPPAYERSPEDSSCVPTYSSKGEEEEGATSFEDQKPIKTGKRWNNFFCHETPKGAGGKVAAPQPAAASVPRLEAGWHLGRRHHTLQAGPMYGSSHPVPEILGIGGSQNGNTPSRQEGSCS